MAQNEGSQGLPYARSCRSIRGHCFQGELPAAFSMIGLTKYPRWGSRFVAASLVVLPLGAGMVSALDFNIRQISDESKAARDPVVGAGGLVAWMAVGTNDIDDGISDIVIWDGQNRRVLTEGLSDSMFGSHRPVVHSNTVVWIANYTPRGEEPAWVLREVASRDTDVPELPASYRADEQEGRQMLIGVTNLDEQATNGLLAARRKPSGLSEIVRWDLGGEVKRITIDYRNDFGPSAAGSLVAWQVAKGFPFGWEIMAWENGNFVQLTTNYYYDMSPKVHGRQVVWYGWDGHDFEIFLYDHDKHQTTQITSNQYDDVSPVLWDGQIAWEGYPAAESDIFLWKGGAIKKLSDNIEDDFNPRIWNGQVVWQGFDGDDFEIYYYDGDKPPFKLTINTWDDTNPDIGERFIVWTSFKENWDAEIFAVDKSGEARSGAEIQVTDNEEEDRDARTAGANIVWQGEREGRIGAFLATPK